MKQVQRNLNKTDGIIRAILGVAFAGIFFFEFIEDSLIANVVVVIGFVLVLSAIIEFCPLYYFLGIKTRQKRRNKFY